MSGRSRRARRRSVRITKIVDATAVVKVEAAAERRLGLRRGRRADPDPVGLQHRRLPRQGRRPERLPPLALRLRPRRAITGPSTRDGGQRPSDRPAGARGEPVPGQGDRPDPARRRAAVRRSARPNTGRSWPGSRRALPRVAGKTHGALVRVAVEPAERPARRARAAAAPRRRPLRRRPRARRDPAGLVPGRTTTRPRRSTPEGRASLLRRAETDLIVRYQSQVVSTRLATLDQSRPEVRLRQARPAQLHRRRAFQAARVAQGARRARRPATPPSSAGSRST